MTIRRSGRMARFFVSGIEVKMDAIPAPTLIYVVMNHVNHVGSFACSLWSSQELAVAESDRLMALQGHDDSQFDVSVWELDSPDGSYAAG